MVATQDALGLEHFSEGTWSELDRLARALHLRDADLQTTLDAIVSIAVDTVSAARYAGLILLIRGQLLPQATIGEPPHTLDLLQQHLGVGPCIDAAQLQTIVRVDDMSAAQRWPTFVGSATARGVASMLCVPLWVDEARLGTLSLYGTRAAAFTDHHVRLARLYATHAALALAAAQRTAHLHSALRNRDLIGQAKGILIERRGLSPDEAFRCLSLASHATNLKITAVARHLVESGELLGSPAPTA